MLMSLAVPLMLLSAWMSTNIQNVNNTDTHYSKHKKVKVSLADVLGTIAKNPRMMLPCGWLVGLLSDWLVRLLSACLSFECLSFAVKLMPPAPASILESWTVVLVLRSKNPLLLKKESDGKVSFTLATATIDKEAERSTKTTVQLSNIDAGAGGI
jgi:hypothetical protein